MAAALFRVRVLLAVVVGVMPPLLVGPFYVMLELSITWAAATAPPGIRRYSAADVRAGLVAGDAGNGRRGVVPELSRAAAGAWFGLRHRQPALAGAFAAGLILLPLVLGLVGLALLGPALLIPFGSNGTALRLVLWVWVFFAAVPLLMTWGMMGAAAKRCETAPPVPAA